MSTLTATRKRTRAEADALSRARRGCLVMRPSSEAAIRTLITEGLITRVEHYDEKYRRWFPVYVLTDLGRAA